MKRGEVWWADLGQPKGSEPALVRPVIVVQDDLLTQSRLATVMVVPLTTNLRRAAAIGNVEVSPKDSGLKTPSVAMVCQVMSVDKLALFKQVGSLARPIIRKIDAGLALALGLQS